MAINIGINSWVWTSPFTNESLHLIQKAADMGFDAFEVPVEDVSHFNADKVKDALKASGLKPVVCGAFGPSRDLTNEDPKYRKESLDYIKAVLKLCEKWGAKVL